MSAAERDGEREVVRSLRHDLRTPVNHILGYGQLLLEDAEGAEPAELATGLAFLCADGNRALPLIDAITASGAAGAAPAAEALAALAAGIAARAAALAGLARDHGRAEIAADLAAIEDAARQLIAVLDGQRGAAVATAAPAEPPVAPATILIADDNAVNRDVLRRRLERLGYRVLAAEDGREALEMLAAAPVDCLLLDIMMPELDGYAVLERRRADPRLREIPVIMISSIDEVESIARCITLGADDYLPKPFNPVILQARLDASLERKRRREGELADLRDVARLAEAAAAVEADTFRPESVAAVAARGDALGHLARVFQRMAAEVQAREGQLRAQLQERSYVFLSYASVDRARALALAEQIERAGVRVWIDRQDIAAGTQWGAEIVQSIRGCTALLVLCSAAAMASRNVRQEIQVAWKYGRPYLPLILEPITFPAELEYQLEGWQWVEILGHPSATWLPPLLEALARLGLEAGPPPSDSS